jgi:hypothetical protein
LENHIHFLKKTFDLEVSGIVDKATAPAIEIERGAQEINSMKDLPAMVGMKPDYYVVTFEAKASAKSWHWEIRRRSNPMGVRLTEGGYQTQMAAEHAGKLELAKFLDLLAKEERGQR